MARIYAVYVSQQETVSVSPVFITLAEHEQEARKHVIDSLEKAMFLTKLKDGEAHTIMMDVNQSFAENSVIILAEGKETLLLIGEHILRKQLAVLDMTATVHLMVTHLRDYSDRKPNLLTAVAAETGLAEAYRRHLPLLEDWLKNAVGLTV